jgi:hypothetical protein
MYQKTTLFCDSTDHKLYLFAGIIKNSQLTEMRQEIAVLREQLHRLAARLPQEPTP